MIYKPYSFLSTSRFPSFREMAKRKNSTAYYLTDSDYDGFDRVKENERICPRMLFNLIHANHSLIQERSKQATKTTIP